MVKAERCNIEGWGDFGHVFIIAPRTLTDSQAVYYMHGGDLDVPVKYLYISIDGKAGVYGWRCGGLRVTLARVEKINQCF